MVKLLIIFFARIFLSRNCGVIKKKQLIPIKKTTVTEQFSSFVDSFQDSKCWI